MKKILILLSVCIMFAGIMLAGDPLSKSFIVDVTTTGVTARDRYRGRKSLLLINGDTTNTVYLSSAPITSLDYNTVGCIPLTANGGYYEDNYYVYKSTWYACTSTGTAKLYLLEKE